MMSFQYYHDVFVESTILFECACVQQTNKHSSRTTNLSQCHQTILQPALIIGTLISCWHVNWSGNARLPFSVILSIEHHHQPCKYLKCKIFHGEKVSRIACKFIFRWKSFAVLHLHCLKFSNIRPFQSIILAYMNK